METERRASWARIVRTDYLSFLLFLIPVIFWGILILAAVVGVVPRRTGQEAAPVTATWLVVLIAVNAGITILLGTLLVRRVRGIRRLLLTGEECGATVIGLRFFKDRGRIEYTYTAKGRTYAAGSAVFRTAFTEGLREGASVTVLVDPENPEKSLLGQLYS